MACTINLSLSSYRPNNNSNNKPRVIICCYMVLLLISVFPIRTVLSDCPSSIITTFSEALSDNSPKQLDDLLHVYIEVEFTSDPGDIELYIDIPSTSMYTDDCTDSPCETSFLEATSTFQSLTGLADSDVYFSEGYYVFTASSTSGESIYKFNLSVDLNFIYALMDVNTSVTLTPTLYSDDVMINLTDCYEPANITFLYKGPGVSFSSGGSSSSTQSVDLNVLELFTMEFSLTNLLPTNFSYGVSPGTSTPCDVGVLVYNYTDIWNDMTNSSYDWTQESSTIISTTNACRKKRTTFSVVGATPVNSYSESTEGDFQATVYVAIFDDSATLNPGDSVLVNLFITLFDQYFIAGTISVTLPDLIDSISKQVYIQSSTLNPSERVKFSTVLSVASDSTIYDVTLQDQSADFDIATKYGTVPAWTEVTYSTSPNTITITEDSVDSSDSLELIYSAYLDEDTSLIGSILNRSVTVSYYTVEADISTHSRPIYYISDSVCIDVNQYTITKTVYDYQWIIWALLIAFFIGMILAIIIWLCVVCVCMKADYATIHPSKDENRYLSDTAKKRQALEMEKINEKKRAVQLKEKSKMFFQGLNAKFASAKETYLKFTGCLLTVLGDDAAEARRKLQRWNISDASVAEKEFDELQIRLIVNCVDVNLAIEVGSRHITAEYVKNVLKKFHQDVNSLSDSIDKEQKKNFKSLLDNVDKKSEEKLNTLKQSHQKKRSTLKDKLKESGIVSVADRKTAIQELERALIPELEELTHRLALERSEQMEKCNKEHAIRKKLSVKESAQRAVLDVITTGKNSKLMTDRDCEFLMRQYMNDMSTIDDMMNDIISHRRIGLDERYEHHMFLTELAALQDKFHSKTLNTMATFQKNAIEDFTEDMKLPATESSLLLKKLRNCMVEQKFVSDTERVNNQRQLDAVWSNRIETATANKIQENNRELAEFDNKYQQTKNITFIEYVQERMKKQLKLQTGLDKMIVDLEQQSAVEYEKMRDALLAKIKSEILRHEKVLMNHLKEKGLQPSKCDQMFTEQEAELTELMEQFHTEKARLWEVFEKHLSDLKKQWLERKEVEDEEYKSVVEHEDKMITNLMAGQLCMSDGERERILREHQKNLVTLENSLALSRIEQQRKLEEALAHKRSRRLVKLERRQAQENQEHRRARQLHDGTDDITDIDLIMKHLKEVNSVHQDQKSRLDTEIENVRVVMLEERTQHLKKQEEQMAAMMAELQLDKAKQFAKIDEQHRMILQLRLNLIDELASRGKMKDPRCQQILEEHQQQVVDLEKTLDNQRQHQENELQRKVRDRLSNREEILRRKQEEELRLQLQGSSNKTAVRLRMVALQSKQKRELEDVKNKIEKEISQTVEDLKRDHELSKMKALEDLENKFIKKLLVVHGGISKEEMYSVFCFLFPIKPEEDIQTMVEQLYTDPRKRRPPLAGHDDDDEDRPKITAKSGGAFEGRVKEDSIKRLSHNAQKQWNKLRMLNKLKPTKYIAVET